MRQTEERLHKPFYYPKERYDDSFVSGYSQGIYHMRQAISHLQDQTDSPELQELYLYSLHLIQEMKKTFNTNQENLPDNTNSYTYYPQEHKTIFNTKEK